MRRAAYVVLIGLIAVGARAEETPASPRPIDHPGLRPGEAYTYRFNVGPIEGARARMSVGLPVTREGRTLVAVQGEAETLSLVRLVAPVSASYVLTLDADTLLPQEITSTEKGMRDRKFHSLVD